MKKTLTILFILIITSCFSQDFPQTGSHWHRSMDIVVCPGNGYYHHRYTQDTLITNKLFSKIENIQFFSNFDPNSGSVTYDNFKYPSTFLRQSGDTLYHWDDQYQVENLAWYKNPFVGDLWYLGKVKSVVDQSDIKVYCRVDSIKYEIIQGQFTKWIVCKTNLDSTGSPINYYTNKFDYIKKFNTLLGPIHDWFDPNTTSLTCFESQSISEVNYSGLDCNSGIDFSCYTITNTKDHDTEGISTYPNPVIDKMFIDNCQNHFIDVSDLHGKVILNKTISNKSDFIDLTKLNHGTYLLIMDGEFVKKFQKN
jgi:hypothetical protein